LSILPDGLSDLELLQSKLPIEDIWNCRTTLIRTALAYLDDKKRLKALVPIREYMKRNYPLRNDLVETLLKHFHELLALYAIFSKSGMISAPVGKILPNLANIQSLLQTGLQQDHPDLKNCFLSALHLNIFSRNTCYKSISLLGQLYKFLPYLCDHQLEVDFIIELFESSFYSSISNPETLVAQALEHFKYIDNPDLQCEPICNTLYKKTDLCGSQVDPISVFQSIIQHTGPLFPRP
jgi:hypothetical protein